MLPHARPITLVLTTLFAAACADTTHPSEVNAEELITTVVLVAHPVDGSDDVTATWADPESDGSPVVDVLLLNANTTYELTVAFLNEAADPSVNQTPEIEAESDQHQLFFTGGSVNSPATGSTDGILTLSYADADVNGLPVGLKDTLEVGKAGDASLQVVLRHLPPEGGVPVKVEGLAEQLAASGLASLPGETDAQVEFAVTVEAAR